MKFDFGFQQLANQILRMRYHCLQSCFTFTDAAAETTLVPTTTINKLHVGTHVGLAAVAANGARLTVVHNVEGSLDGDQHKTFGQVFNNCNHNNSGSSM